MPLTINNKAYILDNTQFVTQARVPDKICLHYTAGTSVEGAFQTWKKDPNKVATPYIVADQVYEVHPALNWAWHMGTGNTTFEKTTIGIEIVNPGYLKLVGSDLLTDWNAKWCSITEKEKYVALAQPWRGQRYFAAYPQAQQELVAQLCEQLCRTFGIQKTLLPAAKWFDFSPELVANGFKGIFGHQNVINWKFDPGPAFDHMALRRYLGSS